MSSSNSWMILFGCILALPFKSIHFIDLTSTLPWSAGESESVSTYEKLNIRKFCLCILWQVKKIEVQRNFTNICVCWFMYIVHIDSLVAWMRTKTPYRERQTDENYEITDPKYIWFWILNRMVRKKGIILYVTRAKLKENMFGPFWLQINDHS